MEQRFKNSSMSIEEETDMAGNSQCPPGGFFTTRRNLQRPPEFFQQPQQQMISSQRHEEPPPQWLSPLPPMMPLMISRTEAHEQPPPQWISSRRHGEAEAHEQPQQKRPRLASDPSTQLQTIFFKTRPCRMFEDGNCPHGLNCTFAHGPEDLRQPPPNWQEIVAKEQSQLWQLGYQHQHRPKICKRFYNGERCQYGDRCTFLHIRPNASKNNEGFGKSKRCHKYEKHGHCPNGDRCPYAHGSAGRTHR